MSVSRICRADTRTVVLLEDGTTELREGGPEADVSVVGSMPRAVVRMWSTSGPPKVVPLDDVGDAQYEVKVGDDRIEWRGSPQKRLNDRAYSMLTGVWGTVASTPL